MLKTVYFGINLVNSSNSTSGNIISILKAGWRNGQCMLWALEIVYCLHVLFRVFMVVSVVFLATLTGVCASLTKYFSGCW